MNSQNTNRKRVHKIRTTIVNLLDTSKLIETQVFHKLMPLILTLSIKIPNSVSPASISTCIRDFYVDLNIIYLNQIKHLIKQKENIMIGICNSKHLSPELINTNKNKHLWSRVYEQLRTDDPLPVISISPDTQNLHFWQLQQTSNYSYSSNLRIAINPKYTNDRQIFEEPINNFVKKLASSIVS